MKKTKIVVFLLIFCIIFYYVYKILWNAPTPITYFYKEPTNSLDVIYIGSSNAYAQFNSVLAYNKYGYTTGLLSADSQPFVLTKYLIEEAKKYQKTYVYVIDLAKSVDSIDSLNEYSLRKTIDSMKFSKNRIEAINELLKYRSGINKKEYVNYYFSFLFYHNKWKSPTKLNIIRDASLYKGYLFDDMTASVENVTDYHYNQETMELEEESKQILEDLIEYVKANNINVLFVVPIRSYYKENSKRLNTVINILQENDLKVLNFNVLDDFNNIDFSNDFYNDSHLNVYGATKYTLYFSKYLKDNYNLPDHRGDVKYESWDKEYERFKTDYKKITNKEFDELLMEYDS